jgi:hypothetical protein
MGTIVNPTKVTWVDPTTGTDATGATVPWDATTDRAAVEIQFDGVGVVDVPVSTGVDTLDLTTVAAFEALPAGAHSLTMAEVTKEGTVGKASAATTFSVDHTITPDAPTSVKLA